MKLKFHNSFWGYFQFYYGVVGNRLITTLFLSIAVSFLDGIGLAMFLPLLQLAGKEINIQQQSIGNLHYLTDFIHWLGFSLTINAVLIVMVLLFTLKGLIKYFQLKLIVYMKHFFISKLRYALTSSLEKLSFKGFLKLDSGRIQNTFTAEVQSLQQAMNAYFDAFQECVMLLTYIVIAVFTNYQFALLVLSVSLVSNFIYRRAHFSIKEGSVKKSKSGDAFSLLLIQSINHFKYLKSTASFSGLNKRIKLIIDQTEHINRNLGNFGTVSNSIKEPLIISIVATVVYFQVHFFSAGIGSVILSLLLFYRALNYLIGLQNNWQRFVENTGSMNAVATLYNEMDSLKEEQKDKHFNTLTNVIHLKNLYFSYNPSRQIVTNLDIRIPKNKTIALVGGSGSGKTTIANLIAGLIEPEKGDVLIDGTPLREYDFFTYRSKVGYISQEPVIFNDTIFNNITFWAEPSAANAERFQRVVRLASLDTFIASLPEMENSNLGDNGILISGGQKQRISIARELYKDIELLIMDEATSSLDSETEIVIRNNIDQLHGQYTMVIIAHRLSTIRMADHIYLIDGGQVVSQGTFASLMSESDRFRGMVAIQNIQ